ncbi:MAG: hypothetical protein KC502_19090 [Myxococcales bacterium]|nr:hypothetical protein [Myxococcales bacterium]
MEPDRAIEALASPTLTRTRATVVATEATTTGMASAIHLALILGAIQRPDVVATFVQGSIRLALAMAILGLGWLVLVRNLRLGRSAQPSDPLWRSLPVALTAGGALALLHLMVVIVWWGDAAGAVDVLVASLPVPVVTLAVTCLRAVGALEGRSRTPLADLLLATSHGLLGGLAVCLLVGLLSRGLSAEMTYELGVGTTMVALWTSIAAGRVLHGSQRFLHQEKVAGRRWPTSRGSLRSAMLIVLFGVLTPATVMATSLLSARLTGVELACVALAVSVHTLRYATVTMRYGPAPDAPLSGMREQESLALTDPAPDDA